MNHYDYMDLHLKKFFEDMGYQHYDTCCAGIVSAHGDKFYGYRRQFQEAGIHFFHGCMIMMLTYIPPWCDEVRETGKGWVNASDWAVKKYDEVKHLLPKVEEDNG